MGKYNFDKITDRRGTNSLKWNVAEGELPMWVADMDFETAPEIIDALNKRVVNGIFGYEDIPESWYDAYINWWGRRHNTVIKKEWLIYSAGVIPTLSSSIRKLSTPAENVVILTPVYNMFYNSIRNNGRNILECEMKYEDGDYSIDYDDLEDKLSKPQTSIMIFCNPHNPIGRIWDKDTLEKVGQLCLDNGVKLIVDEIHCDITAPDKEYVSYISLSDELINNAVVAISPTKAFNMAGIQTSAVVVPDRFIRHKVWRQINTDEVGEPNSFAIAATLAAFNEGECWLDELREYIYQNRLMSEKYIGENLEGISIMPLDATYLMWLDVSCITSDSGQLAKHIRKTTGLYLSAGSHYGKGGDRFLRINIACPRTRLEDGLERLKKGIDSYRDL